MISFVRRKFVNNSAYKVLLWVFLLMMMFGSGASLFRGKGHEDWVVKVYKQTMNKQTFQSRVEMAKRQLEMYRQKGIILANKNVKKDATVEVVSQFLLAQIMNNLAVRVSQEQIDATIKKQLSHLPAQFFHENGDLNYEVFQQAIAPHSIDDFVADIEMEIKNKVLYGLIDASIYIPEFELALQYNAEFADKSYSYLLFSLHKYLDQVKNNQPSEETLQKFYKKPSVNESFKTPEERAGFMWTFDVSSYGLSASSAEVKAYYDKVKAEQYLLASAQVQIRNLLITYETGQEEQAKIKINGLKAEADANPEGFEHLVRKASEDKATASRGGLSSFFAQKDEAVEKIVVGTAFEALDKDGQISVPLKTSRGYEIIQRVARKSAKYKELADVASEIKSELIMKRFKQRFAQDASRVITSAKYTPDILQKFVEKHQGVKATLPLHIRQAGLEDTYLFKIEAGRFTTYFNKSKGIIISCSEVVKSKIPELSSIRHKVLDCYYEQIAKVALAKDLEAAFKQAQNATFKQIAIKYGASEHTASFNYNDGKVEESSILKDQKLYNQIKGMASVGAVLKVDTANNDGIIMKLDSVGKKDEQLYKKQRTQLLHSLFYTKMYQNKDGFIASLYRTAKLNNKVEIKKEVLDFTKEV